MLTQMISVAVVIPIRLVHASSRRDFDARRRLAQVFRALGAYFRGGFFKRAF